MNNRIKIPYWNQLKFIPYRVKDLPGERWCRIKNFSRYLVSNYGRIKRVEREYHCIRYSGLKKCNLMQGLYYPEMILKQNKSKKSRYYKVTLVNDMGRQKRLSVHKLVAIAFVPNPNDLPQVHHKDGNPLNNCADNLEWVTAKENNRDNIRRWRLSETKIGVKRKPLSKEHRAKIRKTCIEKQINCKPVIVGDKVFASSKEAASFLGYADSTVRNWINNYSPMPEKFKKMGLRYLEN